MRGATAVLSAGEEDVVALVICVVVVPSLVQVFAPYREQSELRKPAIRIDDQVLVACQPGRQLSYAIEKFYPGMQPLEGSSGSMIADLLETDSRIAAEQLRRFASAYKHNLSGGKAELDPFHYHAGDRDICAQSYTGEYYYALDVAGPGAYDIKTRYGSEPF